MPLDGVTGETCTKLVHINSFGQICQKSYKLDIVFTCTYLLLFSFCMVNYKGREFCCCDPRREAFSSFCSDPKTHHSDLHKKEERFRDYSLKCCCLVFPIELNWEGEGQSKQNKLYEAMQLTDHTSPCVLVTGQLPSQALLQCQNNKFWVSLLSLKTNLKPCDKPSEASNSHFGEWFTPNFNKGDQQQLGKRLNSSKMSWKVGKVKWIRIFFDTPLFPLGYEG